VHDGIDEDEDEREREQVRGVDDREPAEDVAIEGLEAEGHDSRIRAGAAPGKKVSGGRAGWGLHGYAPPPLFPGARPDVRPRREREGPAVYAEPGARPIYNGPAATASGCVPASLAPSFGAL
jgi:hypothetical protein